MKSWHHKIHDSSWVLHIISFLLFVFLIILSLGQTARWDFLEQLHMADRFELKGSIYPKPDDHILTGVSVYFPGLSLITILVKKLVSDNFILRFMQLFACSVIVIFFLIQKRITKSFIDNLTYPYFLYASAIFYIFFNFDWLIYAVEFKPDTIAYCFGCIGIILSGVDKKTTKSNLYLFFGAVITGFGILFKQQFIFFLIGMFFHALVKKDKRIWLFTVVSCLISISIIASLRIVSNFWFWTIKVLEDDGFMTLKLWIDEHKLISIKYLLGLVVLILFFRLKFSFIPKNSFNYFKDRIVNNIWFLIMLFVFLGSVMSSFKVGGNAGNTAFGLIIIFPLILYFLQNIKSQYLFSIFLLIFLFLIPYFIVGAIKKYKDSLDIISKSKEFISSNDFRLLTGSNLYFAARNFRGSNLVSNYWMYSLKDNSNIYDQLANTTIKSEFDFLLVENWHSNKNFLSKSKKYTILFENNIGIIAINNTLLHRNMK